ncbi:MAG: diadenylate cyclase CdaA [Defluviitaleaceae bacterium]|nr:diadenylate cyclase CdaA [Defluviitaleaceae bacterium]
MFTTITNWLLEITNVPVFNMPEIGLVQVLDILIIASLLHLVLRWIRRTQAWVLLKGIAFVLIIALFAEIFNLVTVQWIVQNTIGMGLVVVVILFQPELRKALEQIGRGQYLFNLRAETEQRVHTSAHTVDEIIKATRAMANSLTGAIIVLEQEVDLSEHERTGVMIDAQVSARLLMNIFEKNAPLHDGAVVIRENRISSASCILPLTAESIDNALGTRHRAAIGITEHSDARVVVVSEETGIISLAVDGKLTRDVTENHMRDLLIWGEPVKSRFSLFIGKKRRNKS